MSSSGTILLVDDEPNFIRLVSDMLEGEGYVLAEANSGESAIEVYAQIRPDLVMLDVMMVGIDGYETCRNLKKIYGRECAPVIFFTSRANPKEIAEGFAAGGADYLAKPCRRNEVRARIRNHLQRYILFKQQKLLVDQLSRANAAKNRFIGMAAHDMRNPLVSIRGFAEFLIDGTVGPLTTQQLPLATIIHTTSQGMLNTLSELLDVATIESGELRLQLASHNISEIVAKSVALTKLPAAKKRMSVMLTTEGAGPVLMIDADKFRQVVDNLLTNAIKFSPPGSTVTVIVGAGRTPETCGFVVRDQGPGIPENERHKLFKNFGRLSVQATFGEHSTGLGLAICRNIIEAHHGSITAENLPGGGCEFRVALPGPA